jgi:hypothetical protein
LLENFIIFVVVGGSAVYAYLENTLVNPASLIIIFLWQKTIVNLKSAFCCEFLEKISLWADFSKFALQIILKIVFFSFEGGPYP